MPSYLYTPSGAVRLHIQSFSAPVSVRDRSVQVRGHSVPFTMAVQQPEASLAVQCASPGARDTLVALIRQHQRAFMASSDNTCTLLWPEKNIAYEGFIRSIQKSVSYTDVAPRVSFSLSITKGLVATKEGAFTGQNGASHIYETIVTHVFSGSSLSQADQQADALQCTPVAGNGAPLIGPGPAALRGKIN